jgi:transcriptional regulator with XRE-family HTH domain
MKKNRIKERAKKVPIEIKRMVERSMATAKEINKILERQGRTQKDLADLLGKKESEISKWMRGTHNFTYKTICKIEIVLGEQIILLPEEAIRYVYILNPIKAGAEQTICISAVKEAGFTQVKKGEKIDFKQSVSSKHNNESIIKLLECIN